MAAPKGKEKLNQLFDEIIIEITERGSSIGTAIKNRMSTQTFYDLLRDDEKSKRYARATEIRTDKLAEEILTIADTQHKEDSNYIVQRDRLRVDSRKWILAKLNPKKFGDKIDMTSDNKEIQFLPSIILIPREQTETDD